MSKKIRVAVFVDGGAVTFISSDSPSMVDVVVIDFDDGRALGETPDETIPQHTFQDGSDANDFQGDEYVVFG